MKKFLLYLILLLLKSFPGYSQDIVNNPGTVTNEAIQQIKLPGIDDILTFQMLNRDVSNYVLARQTGNSNTVNINQQKNAGLESNQAYTVQSGNLNELTIGQAGTGNLLLGFQLGYLANQTGSLQESQITVPTSFVTAGSLIADNTNVPEGDSNKMTITQTGTNNGVLAVQQGTGNTLSAEQNGNNNYLLALQQGTKNTITDYKQENKSANQVLYDRIIQMGDNLTLTSDVVSKSSTGNTFMQTGSNLSLEMNSDLLNSPGGIQITQTGKDMKVLVDQSYFYFPLK